MAVVKEQVAIPGIGACRLVELSMSFAMVAFDVVRSDVLQRHLDSASFAS